MEFADLKVIWDAQNATTLYAYDRSALEKRIAWRSEQVKRHVDFVELVLAFIMATVGLVTLSKPLLFGDDVHQFANGGIFLLLAAYLWTRRRVRQRMQPDFGSAMTEMLDEAICYLDHHIRHVQSMTSWLGIPYVAVLVINYVVAEYSQPLWLWVVLLAALPLGLWVNHRGIQRSLIPRKRALENLREKLKELENVPPAEQ